MIYIKNISQISIQKPLSEEGFENPEFPTATFSQGQDPDFKPFVAPAASRRMGRLFKRAIATSMCALDGFPVEKLEGIITGTGLGCIENTEKFLVSMIENDEKFLQPTHFMQSTHNTIGSQIALMLGCRGYNNTYSHRGTSFDSSLMDAYLQMNLDFMDNVLVGSHDEMTPNYFTLLGKSGYWKEGNISPEILKEGSTSGSISGICSLSMLLSKDPGNKYLCEVADFAMLYNPDTGQIAEAAKKMLRKAGINSFDAVVAGISGDAENDNVYKDCFSPAYGNAPVVWYKHLFGESFSASAFGVYVGAICLTKGKIPAHLIYEGECANQPHFILIHNHFQNKDHSLTLLKC